jgi:hypothetical protein
VKEGDWHAGLECSKNGIVHISDDILVEPCEICREQIGNNEYCH